MLDREQALAYARADFEEPHRRIVELCLASLTDRPETGCLLDLGCGPGDITLRLARGLPGWEVEGVDGSPAMLQLARAALSEPGDLAQRIRFTEGRIPEITPARSAYDVVFSNSLLHHLPDPGVLWATVRRFARPGGRVYVADLFRPESRDRAAALVEQYSGGEPAVLKRDFFNSLLAAFTVEEVRFQLEAAGLARLDVQAISDRHLTVTGTTGE